MKYVILVETGADMPKEIAARYGIYIVRMHVTLGEEFRADGTFPTTEVFDYYKRTGKLPTTSGCNVEDFQKIFDEIHAAHPESKILYLAYSAVTTCSYQSGLIAAEGRDYVIPVDTKQVTSGQTLVALLMARYLEAHPEAEMEEAVKQAETYRAAVHMCFFPGDLDYLRAGGRVSNAAYLGAKILLIKPLIEIFDGYLTATKKYRGAARRVYKKLLSDFPAQYHLSREILMLNYSPGLAPELMQELEAQAKEMGFQEIIWVETGSVVSMHAGPGAFGISGISDDVALL